MIARVLAWIEGLTDRERLLLLTAFYGWMLVAISAISMVGGACQ